MTTAPALPTRNRLIIDVAGLPETQGSMKAFRTASGRTVLTSDNKRLTSWRHDVMVAAREQLDASGGGIFLGPLVLCAWFQLPRPKGHYGKRGLLPSAPAWPAGANRDLDKLVRSVGDALTGAGVWRDDGQVVDIVANKRYGDRPGVRIEVVAVLATVGAVADEIGQAMMGAYKG